MSRLRITVILVTIIALLAFVDYTLIELVNLWHTMITLSHMPITVVTEQSADMLLVDTIVFSILIIILLIAIMAILEFIGRLL
jgi:uncharacterized membrane protein YqhA